MPSPGLSAKVTTNASNMVPILAESTFQAWRPLHKREGAPCSASRLRNDFWEGTSSRLCPESLMTI